MVSGVVKRVERQGVIIMLKRPVQELKLRLRANCFHRDLTSGQVRLLLYRQNYSQPWLEAEKIVAEA